MAKVDLKLNSSWDIELDDNNDLELIAGVDLVAQRVITGLRLFSGEWFLAEGDGVPYYAQVLVNAPKSTIVEALLRKAIMSDNDIERLESFSLSSNRALRELVVSFAAISSEGVVNARAILP